MSREPENWGHALSIEQDGMKPAYEKRNELINIGV